MKFKEGKINRVFLVTFSHGENFISGIKDFIKSKDIRFGTINIIGAFRSAEIVTGPIKTECPPEPDFRKFEDAHEVLGFGFLTNTQGDVNLHFHGTIGKGDSTVVGCLRQGGEVFVTIEALVTEIDNIQAKRYLDDKTKCNLLEF